MYLYITGTFFTTLRLLLHKVSFATNTLFVILRETLIAGCVKPSPEASELFSHAVFQLVVVRKTAPSDSVLQRAKKTDVRGAKSGRGRKKFKVQTSAGKVMASVFWVIEGILLAEFLKRGVTINSER
jgi:hypothetical protein